MKKALIAGFGGIGSNVYYPELKSLGYSVDILDKVYTDSTFTDVTQIYDPYDIAVVATPNFTHANIASWLANYGTKHIFVEKPGVSNVKEWQWLCDEYKNTQFHLVKNNLYRDSYGEVMERINDPGINRIDILWMNNNRIPNPGSWFTDKGKSFGGVSKDLMPHLICFAIKMFGKDKILNTVFQQKVQQKWRLDQIDSTDYGTVYPDGIFNVDDAAYASTTINGIPLNLVCSWKEGYDKQSIVLYYEDGKTYEWHFGLCPANAYGKMLQDTSDSVNIDTYIHTFLDKFND